MFNKKKKKDKMERWESQAFDGTLANTVHSEPHDVDY